MHVAWIKSQPSNRSRTFWNCSLLVWCSIAKCSFSLAMAEGTKPDYWKTITEQRDKVMAVLKEKEGWTEGKNKDGIVVSYKQTDKGRIWHVTAQLDCSPKVGKRYMIPVLKGGLREKFVKKSPLKDSKLVEDGENYYILHEILAGAMMGVISERDFVSVYGGEDEGENGAYLIQCSVEHPDYPAQPKPVRATKHLFGDVFLPVEGNPDKCIYHEVSQVDMGGMLPVSVLNSFLSGIMHGNTTELKQAVANKFHEKN